MFLTFANKNYIKDVLKSILYNLNYDEFTFVSDKCCDLIDHIHTKFLIKEEDNINFFNQLTRKKNRDIIAIFNMLLPFIDDSNQYEKHKRITSLSDITLLKENDKYVVNNFQYSRGYYNKEKEKYMEYSYSTEDVRINFELLKETINRVSIKMYVNWLNIVPVVLEKYTECLLYKNTMKYYNDDNQKYKDICLQPDEIYDTIVNELYLNVLDFKWLLFEKNILIDGVETNVMYLDILNDIYPVYNIIGTKETQANSKWLLLDEDKKKLFNDNMDMFYNSIKNNESYKKYPFELIDDFGYYFLCFFDIKYNGKDDELYKNNYKKVNPEEFNSDEILDDDEMSTSLKDRYKKQYYENYKKIDKYYLYDFIRGQLIKLSKSWYGYKIFSDKKKIKKLHEFDQNETVKYDLTEKEVPTNFGTYTLSVSYKNVYNYSKSFTILSNTPVVDPDIGEEVVEQNVFTYLYHNKDKVTKEVLADFIVNIYHNMYHTNLKPNEISIINSNFSIRKNLMKKYEIHNYSNEILKSMNLLIFKSIHLSILDIIFECLCKRGILTEFVIRNSSFEKENISNDSNKNKFYEHLKKYNKAYYYLTDDRFENLPRNTNNKSFKETTYFERLRDDLSWYHTYAMDWVSQINFFHHFINQRVVMLTGGTGVGKSTQTPKLLLYGLKAIDKKFNGKIICTQPRIAPTINNAQQISKELGVSITNYNAEYNSDVRTIEGIIQYKYEKDDHIGDDDEYFLRLVTDGSLLVDIKKSPLIKQLINVKSSDVKNKVCSLVNMYDVIIVDESHEHNSNMDMILSLLRGSILLNNDLKLYIISATMELDDPIYRQYYRLINDNLKYPIRDLFNMNDKEYVKNKIKHGAENTVESKNLLLKSIKYIELLDRIVIDRRIHISPPEETTQYKIEEFYNDIDLSEKDAYIKAIQYAKEICSSNSAKDNDILLFCTTTTKIIKLVDELNNVLPSDTLAIPFYSDLPEDSKNLITQNLTKIKSTFKFDKKYIHDVLFLKYKPEEKNNGSNYDRIVIVSTNIAEASITIDTLKFVIDTGFNWNVSYNYETDTNNMESVKISESSRVQRKGRVGRVANGAVYYTYPKDARRDIKPLYDICKKNFSVELLTWLEEKSFFPEGYAIDYICFRKDDKITENDSTSAFIEILMRKIESFRKDQTDDDIGARFNNGFRELYKKFISRQYATTRYYSKKLYLTDKLYNKLDLDKDDYNNIVPFMFDGLRVANILDDGLGFYLIHPFENLYNQFRDSDTRLISSKSKSKKYEINKNTMKKLVLPLIQNLYVYEEKKDVYNKLRIVSKLFEIREKTDKLLEINLLYPLAVSYKLGIFDNSLFIVYFLLSVKFNLYDIIDDIDLFTRIFSSKESDLLVINKIFELFKSTYSHLLFDNRMNNKKEELKEEFKQSYYNYKNGYLNKLTKKQYDDIINLILKNNNIEIFNEKLFNNIVYDKFPEYILLEINNWCKQYGIKFEVFLKIIYEYRDRYLKYKIILDNEKYNKYLYASSIDNEMTVDKNIIKSFMYGNMNKIFILENGIYKNIFKYELTQKYIRTNVYKKWISSVVDNHFLFVFYKENAQIKEEEEETDNKTILLSILSTLDNQLYSKLVYYNDNPLNKEYTRLKNINHQFVCNNPINIEHIKHPDDPKFNEYLNLLQIKMKGYIDMYC